MDINKLIPEVKQDTTNTYEKDGVLYCKKCDTPREYTLTILGQAKKVVCKCDCQMLEYEKIQQRLAEEDKKFRIDRLKVNGIQDKAVSKHTFENDDGGNPAIKNICEKYVDNWAEIYKHNTGFLFYGDVGNGKTFYAHAIGNALIEKGVPVMITDFLKILNKVQSFEVDKNTFYRELNNFKLLVIDDFGAERQTDYALEQVYNVIDQRYKNNQPLIVTTNISLEELESPSDMRYRRICDRLLEMCTPIEFKGESRRRKKAEEKFDEFLKIIGE